MVNENSKYNKSRLQLFLKGVIPSLLSLFTKRNKELIILNSFHNNGFSDNTKFLFEYLIKNENKIVKYVINDDQLREQLANRYGDYFIETKTRAGIRTVLSSYLWFTNSFELPVNGLFLKYRRTVIQLTHGAPIKNAGLCEKDVSFIKKIYYGILRTNISFVLSTSTIFDDYIAKHAGVSKKRVITISYPRYDPLFNKEYTKVNFGDNYKRILYAPTWRHYAAVRLFPFEDFDINVLNDTLEELKVKICLRIHPRFESTIPDFLTNVKNIELFSGSKYPDINEYLENFDAMITDYSSIMYDFMILNKPIFYFDYDYEEYLNQVGFGVDYNHFAIGYHSKTQKQFIEDIKDAFENDKYKEQRMKLSEVASGKSNHNSKDLIEYLKTNKLF